MNTDKNFLGNERLLLLVCSVMLLGISLSQLFDRTWIMIVAVAIQLICAFFIGLNISKERKERESAEGS